MNNPVAPLPKMASVFAKYDLELNKRLSGGISAGFTSIGYKNKIWSLKHQGDTHFFTREDDGTPVPYLDVIIVGANPYKSRSYYPGKWEEDSAGAPVCAASDSIKPDPGVSDPQAKACAICPQAEWVVQTDGRKKPNCQEHKRLAVLLMPRVTTHLLGSPLDEPVFLKIPPASLTQFKTHTESLSHQGLLYFAVVTRIQFDPQHSFRFNFSIAKVLNEKEAPWVAEKLDNPQILRITGEQPEISEIRGVREVEFGPGVETELANDIVEVLPPVPPAPTPGPAPATGKKPPGRPRKVVPETPVAAAGGEEDDMFTVPSTSKAKPAQAAAPVQAAAPGTNGPAKWKTASTDLTQSVDDLLSGLIEQPK